MYTYVARLIKVVDGDTIDLEIDLGFHIKVVKRIRLSYINAPEMNTEEGKTSKNFVEDFLKNYDSIIIKTQLDKTDKYGRMLGEIFIDEKTSLNKTMLDKGFALPYN